MEDRGRRGKRRNRAAGGRVGAGRRRKISPTPPAIACSDATGEAKNYAAEAKDYVQGVAQQTKDVRRGRSGVPRRRRAAGPDKVTDRFPSTDGGMDKVRHDVVVYTREQPMTALLIARRCRARARVAERGEPSLRPDRGATTRAGPIRRGIRELARAGGCDSSPTFSRLSSSISSSSRPSSRQEATRVARGRRRRWRHEPSEPGSERCSRWSPSGCGSGTSGRLDTGRPRHRRRWSHRHRAGGGPPGRQGSWKRQRLARATRQRAAKGR